MAQAHIPVNADYGGRKRVLAIIAVFAALLLSFGQARAATYYVATTGNDGAAGTQAAPWKTIKYAVSKMNAGDTTYVRGGTYNEGMIWFRKSGTASAPIKLLNAPGESPKINFTGSGYLGILIAAGSGAGYPGPIGWIHVEGFEITNGIVGFRLNNFHDGVIRRNWIHHARSQGILGNGRNVLIDRNVINRVGDFAGCAAGKLHSPDSGGIGTVCNKDHAIYGTGPNWVVTNNLIYDNLAFGVHAAGYPVIYHGTKRMAMDESYAGADNWLIANNTIAYHNQRSGIVFWQPGAKNGKVINNILYENAQVAGSEQGVSFLNDGGGHLIQNNLCYATAPGATKCIEDAPGKYTASGNIVNTANPNFVSAGPTISGVPNFHLNAGSPAIDKGITLPQVTWDHDGGARPFGGGFDIGAYEHGSPPDSGSPPPNPTGGSVPPPTGGCAAGGGAVVGQPLSPQGRKTYYVATTGNDSNPGTEAQPFKTIARGSQALSAGDTLLIRAGIYNERMMDGVDGFKFVNGTASAYTRYAAYQGEQVLIRPTKFSNYTVWFSVRNAYIELSGLTIDGENSIYELRTDNSFNSSGAFLSAHHIRVIGNEIRSPNNKIITVDGQTYNPSSCVLFGGGGGNELIGNHIHDCGSYGIYAQYSGGLIEGNVVHDTGRYAVHLFSYHTNDNWIIRNNRFYNNGIRGTEKSPGQIEHSPSVLISHGKNNQVYNNLVYGSHAGIRVWGNADNTLVANNTVYGNKGYGIRVDSTNSDNTRIVNNISYGNGSGQIENVGAGTVQQNNITTNPNFVNAAGGDFHLNAGSAAIDKGVTLPQVPNDFAYGKRPAGAAYDIGAFEHGAPPGTSPAPPLPGGGGGAAGCVPPPPPPPPTPPVCPPGTVPGPGGGAGGGTAVGLPLPPSGTGKTYYVATTGNDSNPGTEAAPFKTIARGSQAMASGDTLLIRAGTYREAMRNGSKGFKLAKGTSAGLTRFAAYPGEQVIIKPADDLLHVIHFSDESDSFVEISGLTIDGADLKGTAVNKQTLDGVNYTKVLTGYGIKGVRSSRIIGNVIRNLDMGMSGGPNTQIMGNEIYNMKSYGIYSGPGDNGVFACNRIHDTGGFAMHHYNAYGKTNSNWRIYNNVIYRVGRGYTHSSSGGRIRTASAVIISSGQGNQFYNNIIYDSNGAISVNYRGVSDTLIANNTVYGNDKYGIIVGSARNTRVINNISYDNGGAAITDNGTGTVQQGNVTTNPNFVNAAGGDFHLNAGSAAIDKGVSLSEVPIDKDGGTRGPAWDAGAYEFGATPDPSKTCAIPPPIPGGGTTGGGGGVGGGLTCVPAPVCPPGTVPSTTGGGGSSLDQPPATGPITPPPPGAGNTYWVATNGNNSNPGTVDSPWKTIAHAVNKMQAGDTTYVRGGTYNEQRIVFKRSGAPGAPIRLLNAPGEKPKIDFGLIEGALNNPVYRMELYAGKNVPIGWITIEGFEITRGWEGLKIYDAHDVVFRRNWVHHSTNQGILGNGTRMFFDRNVINHNGNFARCARGDLTRIGTSVCNQSHGMYITGSNYIITNNLIYDNSGTGIQMAAYKHCPQGGCWGGSAGARAKVYAGPEYGDADGWVVANNVFAYNNGHGPGIQLWQGGATNSKIINNIFYQTPGIKLTVNTGGGHVFMNNICYSTKGQYCISNDPGNESKYTASGHMNINPNFVSAPATLPFAGIADFHLQPGSPAIDRGLTAPNVTTDHDGGPRPFGAAYDVGAYEYGAPPDPNAPAPVITWPPGGGGSTGAGGVTCVPVGCGADVPLPPAEFTGETTTPTGTGRNYYMSPSGNDSNPGTEAAPWRTLDRLQQAQSILRPGDTVWFRGGDYLITNANRNWYSWRADGRSSAPIIYRNYAGETPTIIYDRIDSNNEADPDSVTMLWVPGDYTIVDGLNFRQSNTSRAVSVGTVSGNITYINRPARKSAIAVSGRGATFRNCSIQNFSGLGMATPGSNILVERCSLNNVNHDLYLQGPNSTFRYNHIEGSNQIDGGGGIQIQYEGTDNNLIYGNFIINGSANAVVFSGQVSGNEMFNNVIVNGGSGRSAGYPVGGWCEDGPMGLGNKFYNNTLIGRSMGGLIGDPLTPKCAGIRPISRIEIYNNIFHPTPAVRVGLTQNYSNIRNNIFYNIIGAVPAGNTLVNPNLANPGGTLAADAMLQAGSPAIDAAVDPGPDLDYQAGARPIGARKDIGAFEFGSVKGPGGGPIGGLPPGGGGTTGCPVEFPPPHVIEEGVYLCPP